ncbi:MAG: hypothetical protein ACRD01_05665 [Terriglobales bacterium]
MLEMVAAGVVMAVSILWALGLSLVVLGAIVGYCLGEVEPRELTGEHWQFWRFSARRRAAAAEALVGPEAKLRSPLA